MDVFRQALLLGIVVGVIAELFGIAVLSIFFINNGVLSEFLCGVFFIGLGISLLVKSVPAFIPSKQQKPISIICPYCGAINNENSEVCEKCKQRLE